MYSLVPNEISQYTVWRGTSWWVVYFI